MYIYISFNVFSEKENAVDYTDHLVTARRL